MVPKCAIFGIFISYILLSPVDWTTACYNQLISLYSRDFDFWLQSWKTDFDFKSNCNILILSLKNNFQLTWLWFLFVIIFLMIYCELDCQPAGLLWLRNITNRWSEQVITAISFGENEWDKRERERERERELYSLLKYEQKSYNATFTWVAGCQKGHNTHRAGHLKKNRTTDSGISRWKN